MTSFYEQMQGIRDAMTQVAAGQGHPLCRSLVIRRRYLPEGETMPVTEFLEVDPRPIITTVSPRTAAAFQSVSGVQIEVDDFQAKGISRRYSFQQIGRDGSGYSYFVDGVLNQDKTAILLGTECDFVAATTGSALTWDLVLRRRPDGRNQEYPA